MALCDGGVQSPDGVRKRIIRVLLVDDDLVDRMAVLRGFSRAGLNAEIQVAGDGIEALKILRNELPEVRLQQPYLVLLDLNMPRMDGISFLETVRKDDTLKRTVIFVLTTSDNDEDKLAAYDHFVAGYVLKSKTGRNFEGLLGMLQSYWSVVALPAG